MTNLKQIQPIFRPCFNIGIAKFIIKRNLFDVLYTYIQKSSAVCSLDKFLLRLFAGIRRARARGRRPSVPLRCDAHEAGGMGTSGAAEGRNDGAGGPGRLRRQKITHD